MKLFQRTRQVSSSVFEKTRKTISLFMLVGLPLGAAACNSSTPGQVCSALGLSIKAGAQHPELPNTRFIVKLSPDMLVEEDAVSVVNHFSSDLSNEPKITQIKSGFYGLQYGRALSSSDIATLLHSQDFEYVEPDFVVHETEIPDDPSLHLQWEHVNVQSELAWNISKGGDNVLVAELDSGADYTHPDLAANIYTDPVDGTHGRNFIEGAANPNDPMADDAPTYHGTHVAGIMGAVGNNGIGISGHAQVVKIMPLKFIDSSGAGYTSDAIKGIDYAISKNVQILNNSWGSAFNSQALQEAIGSAEQAGILFVAAAGNSGTDNDTAPFYPASYPLDNVISVAASDINDQMANFSNYGPASVSLAAPGVNIYSTMNGDSYQYLSGTSMATPVVTGVAATMMSLRPDLSYLQIKTALLNSVDLIPNMAGKMLSNGRLNSFKALSAIQEMIPVAPASTPGISSTNCPAG